MPRRNNKNKKKKQSNSGLGRAIKNKWGGKPDIENKASGRVKRKDHIIESQFTSNPSHQNINKLKSITEVNNIQEFVDTMTAQEEINNMRLENEELKLIEIDPTETIESSEIKYQQKLNESELFNYENLPIPRKPKWDKNTTSEELNINSQKVFLNWRRGLSNTAQQTNMEMTPYEKNINVWKQLWNVVERCNLLILIVDARNPLAFISRDLFKYVSEIDNKKKCILMINKADYLTPLQRQYWRKYFDSQNIQILYFSAMREQIRFDLMTKSHRDKISVAQTEKIINNIDENVLKVEDLINIFLLIKKQMKLSQIEIGFIGYPNVGKSSVINVLMRAKKVSVGSTPGKTKHFQTLILSSEIILCDCPGLVFPTLMSSKDDMILNGVISIDHLNNFMSPSRLMIHRIKIKQLNIFYKLKLPTNKKQIKFLTVYDILDSYCHQKKLYTKSKVPSRNEAARVMLKDYVKGKIIYCHFPPNLNSRNKYLFYNGKIFNNNQNNNNQNQNQKIENVLDMNKLNGNNNNDNDIDIMNQELDDDDNNNELYDKITDEEFLQVWKHPLDGYGGLLGTSKKKHEKKARVIRRMEKRQQKQNRGYRHDIDNFKHGSNAIVVSSVPNISVKHKPVVL
eukprot:459987_1